MDVDQVLPLRGGDALRAYFPTGTQIREHREGLTIQDSGIGQMYRYERSSIRGCCKQDEEPLVKDIIIAGEVRYNPASSAASRSHPFFRRVIPPGVSLTSLVEFGPGMVSSAFRRITWVFHHLS